MQYGHCICLKWDESFHPIQSSRQHLIYSRKRLEARLVPYLLRYSLFCVLTSILSHLMTSSVPNLHNTKILKISGTRRDDKKENAVLLYF